MRITCVITTLCLLSASVVTAADNVLGIWAFLDGAPGTEVITATNSVNPSAHTGVPETPGAAGNPVFVDDTPGRYIYGSASAAEPLPLEPGAVQFFPTAARGLKLESVATALSGLDEYTIEFFLKHDASASQWKAAFSMNPGTACYLAAPGGGTSGVTLETYVGSKKTGAATANTLSPLTDGSWHHVAVVYTRSNQQARIYADYMDTPVSMPFTNVTQVAEHALYLGSGTGVNKSNVPYPGRLACVRITTRALELQEFMLARMTAPGEDVVGFWPFKDGAPGEAVGRVTNTIGFARLFGTAAAVGAGENPVFLADAPGAHIFDGKDAAGPFCSAPQSVRFHTEADSGGGTINFHDLITEVSGQAAFTAEFFVKIEDAATWKTALCFPLSGSGSSATKIAIPGISSSAITMQTPGNATYTLSAPLVDDTWHHVAVVHTKGEGDSTIRLHVDYKAGGSFTVQTRRSCAPMVMGCGYFGNVNSATEGLRGRISCFRLTRRALTTDEFLYAASTPVAEADTLFRLPFDGEAGSPFTRTFAAPLLYRYATATHNASANPDYSASVDLNRPFLFSGGTKLGENTSCAEFWGKSDLYTSDWAGSRVAVAADEGLHPESFTLELFAAMRQHQTHAGRGRLLMAKGNGTANTYTWRVTVLQDDRLQLDYYEGDTLRTATTDQAAFTGLAQWKHIAVTYDAAGMELRLLVNYKPVITRTLEQALKTNTAYGYTFGGGIDSYGFNGWMDEIRLSKTALGIEDMLRLKPHEGTLMLIH